MSRDLLGTDGKKNWILNCMHVHYQLGGRELESTIGMKNCWLGRYQADRNIKEERTARLEFTPFSLEKKMDHDSKLKKDFQFFPNTTGIHTSLHRLVDPGLLVTL